MPTDSKPKPNTAVTRLLLAVTALGLFVFVGTVLATVYLFSRTDRGDVSSDSYLLVDLAGPLTDAPQQGGFFVDPADVPPTVTELAAALRKAAADDRIDGVLLHLDSPSGGWAAMQELRGGLDEVRAAGKPCVAYSEVYTTGSYYLASACDKVVLAPSGLSLVSGIAVSVSYYGGTFEKLGIEAEFQSVGDFKSAVEPYERTGPSEPAAAAYEGLIDSLYRQFVATVAQARGMQAEQVAALVDAMEMTPEAALEVGLVDALAFPDSVLATLPLLKDPTWKDEVVNLHPPLSEDELDERITEVSEYVKELRAERQRGSDRIAVIYAEGEILSGDGGAGLFGSEGLTDGAFKRWMRTARQDESVKAVVVRVNSPGGSGLASDMMWHEVKRMQEAGKPVVVSMGDYAASGGYFLAAPADWIVAQPGTLTGSIGVFGGKFNLAGAFDKIGMTTHTFKRGDKATLLSMSKGFTDEESATFQRYLDTFYGVFLGKVAEGRQMEREAVHEVAQGRVWTGAQALDHGLVDELGGLDKALKKAAELAQVEDYGVRTLPEQKTFFEILMEDMAQASSGKPVKVQLETGIPGADEALAQVTRLAAMAEGNGVLLVVPGNLKVE